jgi:hypothetical protein
MELKEKTIKVIELSVEESKLLITLLDYCYHRAEEHQTYVSQYADRIKKFRKQLKIIN